MLTLTDIAHTYSARRTDAVHALRGVTLSAQSAAITALVGPNGSGKSTLFRLITGTLSLQQGSVRMNGDSVRAARLGVVFQSPALDEQLTVFENMRTHAMLYGRTLRRDGLPTDLIDALGLGEMLDRRIATLSGGYRRRVELAKALLPEPALLVLDEPFTGLDVTVRDTFFRVLQDITAMRGLTTLLITHELAVAGLCDRVVLLEEGSVVADDAPARLLGEFGATVVEISGSELSALDHAISAADIATLRLHDRALLLKNTTLKEVLAVLDERDPRIEDMHVRRPSLEDYFIARTGHGLQARDDGRRAA
ncbi:MAG: ABC transporter ATP-binding protein [Bacteroidota bacterium]|nr:ABC transporter ATP-binding protein [Bacteroidota bacterium]